MKSKLLRILSLILVLASLVSVFGVFAYADNSNTLNETDNDVNALTEEDPFAEVLERFPDFELIYQRDFEEGWAITNGVNWVERGSTVSFESELTSEYTNNNFIRFTLGSGDHSYLELNYSSANKTGAVFEMDIMSDDYCHFPSLMNFGTLGSTASVRENPYALRIENNKILFFGADTGSSKNVGELLADGTTTVGRDPFEDPGDVVVSDENLASWTDISNQWLHIAIVFDFTYGDVIETDPDTGEITNIYTPDPEKVDYSKMPEPSNANGNKEDCNPTNYSNYFTMAIYIAPAEEYKQTGELYLVDQRTIRGRIDSGGEGISIVRIGAGSLGEEYWGSSVCFDNIVLYKGANEYGLATKAMGAGNTVNESAEKVYDVAGGSELKTDADYISEAIAFKVGVDYMRVNGERTVIYTDENGNAVGAPFKDENGKIFVPLLPVLDIINYEYYMHEDGMYLDISTGTTSSYISIGKDSATVDGTRIALSAAPGYKDGVLYICIDDFENLVLGKYIDYDAMGLIIVTDVDVKLDRDLYVQNMLTVMKSFIFDYASPDEILEDVKENTNNFTHPYLLGDKDYFDWLRSVYNAEQGDENYDAELKSYMMRFVNEQVLWSYKLYARPSGGGYDTYNGILDDGEDTNGDGNAYELKDHLTNDYPYTYYYKSYSLTQPYLDEGAGYDLTGGRSEGNERTEQFFRIASAWQLTRDVKFLLACYDIAIIFGDRWIHWGPGHFLNCSDASTPFAFMLDLCYDGFLALASSDYENELAALGVDAAGIQNVKEYNDSMGRDHTYYDVKKIECILYEKGVWEGYLSMHDLPTTYKSPLVDIGGSLIRTKDNNWSAVCHSGMIIASLTLLGCDFKYDFERKGLYGEYKKEILDKTIVEGTVSEHSAWLISNSLKSLATYGLDIYAPDGSYFEGPGYWGYGTNRLYKVCLALDRAAGTNYGLMDGWNMDATCYFAASCESSDFINFNFHDCQPGSQETSFFLYVSSVFDDQVLAQIRKIHLAGGKSPTMYDFVCWTSEIEESGEAALDYYASGFNNYTDVYTTRSSWHKGALFVAIHGGANKFGNSNGHNQIDAGTFVYHNNGAVWFVDLGTENYDCYGFWPDDTRYRHYVMKPEGNNTIAVTSDVVNVPWGQKLSGTAYSYDHFANEYGSYVKYDMTNVLAPTVNSWKRAVMLTNSRTTTIIQDEIAANGNQTFYWFGHYSSDYVQDVQLSRNGKTAYMYGKDSAVIDSGKVLRVSIVSPLTDVKFQIMDTYTFVNNDPEKGTFTDDYLKANGPAPKDRSKYSKLAIAGGGSLGLSFNIAVVIELIDKKTAQTDQEPAVEYTWCDIDNWGAPKEGYSGEEDVSNVQRPVAKRGDFSENVTTAGKAFDNGTAFTTSFKTFYRTLTDSYYIYTVLGSQLESDSRYEKYVKSYKNLINEFQAFRVAVTKITTAKDGVISKMIGH